jgi:hypothetical protein
MTQKELTLKEIVDAAQVDLSKINLQRNTAFYLALNMKALQPYVETFEEQRNQIVSKYAIREDENIIIPQHKVENFTAEMKELLNSKVTVTLQTIKLSDLPEQIEYSVISKLLIMIED